MNRSLALLAASVLCAVATTARADDEVTRGAYLTHAADCVACHTAPGGVAFAGGREFKLPFGTLYSPNITPDQETDIGAYSDAEWLKLLHDGVARDGKHVYPAMPYPAYTKMADADALAIKAYLLSLKPVHASPPENRMDFPFSQRWLMVFWNAFNFSDQRLATDDTQSAEWNRGAYLVQALGHCGECHTPRNFMQGLKGGKELAGMIQQDWLAYNLTADPGAGLAGWSNAELDQYLSTGTAPGHGPASGPMAEVVERSLRYLTPADIQAITTYLRGVPAKADGPPAVAANAAPSGNANALGQRIYLEACAGCHLPDGAGRQSAWAALKGDHSTGDPAGRNLVQVLAEGSQIETPQGLMFMHNFTGGYTDEELAALSNFVIGQFSGRQGTVTPAEIRAAKDKVAKPGY